MLRFSLNFVNTAWREFSTESSVILSNIIQTWRNIGYRHSFHREIYMKPVLKLYKFRLIHLLFLWSLLDISKSRTAKRPLTGNLNIFLPIKGAPLPPKPTTPNLFKVCIWGDKAAVYWVILLTLVQQFGATVWKIHKLESLSGTGW